MPRLFMGFVCVLVVVMGDCNGNLGNALGDRGHYDPNVRGLKLIEFANFFNLCPVNFLANCSGLLETFVSHCGRYKSTMNYIFLLNCLSDKIVSCKTFENSIDNTSDHLPIKLELDCCNISVTFSANNNLSNSAGRHNIKWARFLKTRLNHVIPFILIMNCLL